jgi:drug/metabolite transporter (DMT)-like permease
MVSDAGGYRLGLLFVLGSAVMFSLAGALTKSITADAWTILCWRGLIGGVLVVAYAGWLGRDKPAKETFGLGWQGWLLATVGATASVTFLWAFKLT